MLGHLHLRFILDLISRQKSQIPPTPFFGILDFAAFLGQNSNYARSSVTGERSYENGEQLFEIGERLFEIREQLFEIGEPNE